ncbi:MAG: hypothetical protein ABSA02_21625 [Trebonia sp.]
MIRSSRYPGNVARRLAGKSSSTPAEASRLSTRSTAAWPMPYVAAVRTTSSVSRDPSSRLTIAAALPSPVSARARRGSTPICSVSRSRQSGRSPALSAGLIHKA